MSKKTKEAAQAAGNGRLKAAKMKKKHYERELAKLHHELVKLQYWVKDQGLRVVIIFEGRDTAGKGGVTKRVTEPLNPRGARVVALGTPSDRERTQWYFQRYVAHLPAAGEIVVFDRSWYNRSGVERVMGFCTEEEYWEFLHSCPEFERMLVRSGIILLKYWLSVSAEEQESRFQERARESAQALEAQPYGPQVAEHVGRVLQGQGRVVLLHRYSRGPLVRSRGRRQAPGASQLHRAYPRPSALRRRDSQEDQAAAAQGPRRIPASAPRQVALCGREVLKSDPPSAGGETL